jgi:drug/metabolite transporter (DMT)-like permease
MLVSITPLFFLRNKKRFELTEKKVVLEYMQQKSTTNHLMLGIGITLVAYLFFSGASALVSYFNNRFPTIQIIFIQNIVSLFCVMPLALRNGLEPLKTKHLQTHIIRDLFGLVSYFLFFLTIRYLNLIDATVLNYTSPFFVPLIWWIWMKEKVTLNVWWSIVIGFVGIAVILNPSQNIFKLGFVLGIFAGIASACAMCAIRVLNVKKEPLSRTLFYFFSISSILSFPFAWSVWVPPVGIEWLLASAIGIATSIGQICLTFAYRYGTAAYLSPLAYSVVIYNCLISYFIYNKSLTTSSFVGALLIVLGGSLTYILKKHPHTIKETFTNDEKKPPPL